MIFPGYSELYYLHINLLSASAQGKIYLPRAREVLFRGRLERNLEVEGHGNMIFKTSEKEKEGDTDLNIKIINFLIIKNVCNSKSVLLQEGILLT